MRVCFERFRRAVAAVLLLMFSLALSACGGGGGSGSQSALAGAFCADMGTRESLLRVMQSYYLWYQSLPNLDLSDSRYCDLQALVSDLRKQPEDRFSYIEPVSEYTNFFEEGTYQGFGFSASRDADQNLLVRYVYDDSGAGRALLQRGDVLTQVSGQAIAELSDSAWSLALSAAVQAGQLQAVVRDASGAETPRSIAYGPVRINTVLDVRTLTTGQGTRVGYLAYNSFLETSREEFRTAFAQLSNSGLTELVLDLRYNGGGRIDVAAELVGWIASDRMAGTVLAGLRFNDQHIDQNQNFKVSAPQSEGALQGLQRLLVLSTESTCSASELVINGVRPFMSVVQLGDTSCGKPYGSSSITIRAQGEGSARDYALSALMFRVVNSEEFGAYDQGLVPQCEAKDVMARDFGDPEESMLKAALDYIDNATCQVPSAPQAATRSLAAPKAYWPLQRQDY